MSQFVFRKYIALAVMACFSFPVFSMEASGADSPQVLAESKTVKITSQDLEAELQRIPVQYRAEVLASRSRLAKILENLLINKTLATQARTAGLDKEPGIIRQIDNSADKLLAQEQIDRVMRAVVVPDFTKSARELYQLDIEKYSVPETVHASHILVDTKSRTPEEALQRIRQAREQAVAGSKKFDELATEYSDDPSVKTNKGDLGFFAASRMVKPFAEVAFAMSTPGEISEPVKTGFGYHIIQFHEKKPKIARSFEEVQDKIIAGERDKYLNEYRKKMLADILMDPSLKLNEEAADHFLTKKPDAAAKPDSSGTGKRGAAKP